MFDEILSGLLRTEETFTEQVRDAFGQSVDEKVFRPVLEELRKLEHTREEAELREKEIQTLTLELRMIL